MKESPFADVTTGSNMKKAVLSILTITIAVLLVSWIHWIAGILFVAIALGCVCVVRSVGKDLGWTPLHDAAQNNDVTTAEQLIKGGADVDAKTKRGASPLYVAVAHGHKDIAELLIANRAFAYHGDDRGITPLHAAAEAGRSDLVTLLIAGGACVDAQDRSGRLTPLHLAAVRGHLGCVQLLIEKGANCNIKERDGRTALDYAREADHSEVAALLFPLTFLQ